MRVWTLHPRYLDAKGLVALWREALLAQKVLHGLTKGYTNHPQLLRFREQEDPLGAIAHYLRIVHQESLRRGYRFDASKITPGSWDGTIEETHGQLLFEWGHLLRKLESRCPERFDSFIELALPSPHPLFVITEGAIKEWERGNQSIIPPNPQSRGGVGKRLDGH